jgi:hypothetical protein
VTRPENIQSSILGPLSPSPFLRHIWSLRKERGQDSSMLIMSSLNEKFHLKLNVSKYRDVAPFPIEGKGLGFGV